MHIFVFSDLHGNLEALNKIIKCKDYKSSDLKIFLGDSITMGPFPNECVDILRNEKVIYLIGNNDSYIVKGLSKIDDTNMNNLKKQHVIKTRTQMTEQNTTYLKNAFYQYEIKYAGKKLYFTHYAWQDELSITKDPRIPTNDNLEQIFKDISTNYIIYGHQHIPSVFEVMGKTLVDVGSCGMKYPANYVMIDLSDDKIVYTFHKLYYNYSKHKRDFNLKCDDTLKGYVKDLMDEDYKKEIY